MLIKKWMSLIWLWNRFGSLPAWSCHLCLCREYRAGTPCSYEEEEEELMDMISLFYSSSYDRCVYFVFEWGHLMVTAEKKKKQYRIHEISECRELFNVRKQSMEAALVRSRSIAQTLHFTYNTQFIIHYFLISKMQTWCTLSLTFLLMFLFAHASVTNTLSFWRRELSLPWVSLAGDTLSYTNRGVSHTIYNDQQNLQTGFKHGEMC